MVISALIFRQQQEKANLIKCSGPPFTSTPVHWLLVANYCLSRPLPCLVWQASQALSHYGVPSCFPAEGQLPLALETQPVP